MLSVIMKRKSHHNLISFFEHDLFEGPFCTLRQRGPSCPDHALGAPGLRLKKGREAKPAASTSRDFRIELALDVMPGHLGGGQHFLDLACLPGGIELLQPLFAELGHRLHRGFEIFARIEFLRIILQHLPDLSGHRHPVVGVDIDLADAVLDAR